MIKIRKGVFETNSSSMHSLVIMKNDKYLPKEDLLKSVYVNRDGELTIFDGEMDYGRSPFSILSTPIDKFLYLIASYENNEEKRKEITEILKEIIPEIKSIKYPTSSWNDDKEYLGYVDHQSQGLVTEYIKDNNISIRDFLLNGKYIVIIDGDEYGEWCKFKQSGLVNLDDIAVDINPWSRFNTE